MIFLRFSPTKFVPALLRLHFPSSFLFQAISLQPAGGIFRPYLSDITPPFFPLSRRKYSPVAHFTFNVMLKETNNDAEGVWIAKKKIEVVCKRRKHDSGFLLAWIKNMIVSKKTTWCCFIILPGTDVPLSLSCSASEKQTASQLDQVAVTNVSTTWTQSQQGGQREREAENRVIDWWLVDNTERGASVSAAATGQRA